MEKTNKNQMEDIESKLDIYEKEALDKSIRDIGEKRVIYDVFDIDREEFIDTATNFEEAKRILGKILFFGANTKTEEAFRAHSPVLQEYFKNNDWNHYYEELTKVYIKFRKKEPRQLSKYWYTTHIVVSDRTTYVTTEGRFEVTEGIE